MGRHRKATPTLDRFRYSLRFWRQVLVDGFMKVANS